MCPACLCSFVFFNKGGAIRRPHCPAGCAKAHARTPPLAEVARIKPRLWRRGSLCPTPMPAPACACSYFTTTFLPLTTLPIACTPRRSLWDKARCSPTEGRGSLRPNPMPRTHVWRACTHMLHPCVHCTRTRPCYFTYYYPYLHLPMLPHRYSL